MHFYVLLLLSCLTACGGFSQVTLDADPPVTILRMGQQQIGENTPYSFRPDDYILERQQDLHLVIQEGDHSGAANPPSEWHWRVWYAYGGSLDQVQLPKLGPEGDLWLHRGRDHILFVQADPKQVLLVENAWANRMDLQDTNTSKDSKKDAKPGPPLRYHRVPPGELDLETKNWHLQADLPAGLTLLFEEGAGAGKFVHVAFPQAPSPTLMASHGADKVTSSPIPTPFLSMSRILEADKFTENYYPYITEKELRIEVDLGGGKKLELRCSPKSKTGSRPPLILCLCPGR